MPTIVYIAGFVALCLISTLTAIVLFLSVDKKTLEKELKETKKALEDEKLDKESARVRLEKVNAQLKAEISTLEGDLSLCRDPSVIRDRLRRVLSGTSG